MSTLVLPVPDLAGPGQENVRRAARALRAGRLVAFPTETVYGLGANALDAAAVGRIFEAKGRPANNPLIVHIPEAAVVRRVAATWPESAARLARRFWPGPLTLVLPKQHGVPHAVTAGGPTVAVRVPANAVALALLREVGTPLAAPSANPSSELSPTRAEHVFRGLAGRVDMILDGGPTTGGIESTVLDLTTSPPRLLRPGLISPSEIEAEIGPINRVARTSAAKDTPLPSPGTLPKHYAPRTKLYCVESSGRERVVELTNAGRRVGWIPFGAAAAVPGIVVVQLPMEAAGYAARLYGALHELDHAGLDAIVVELPPTTDEWLAVRDRLRRGAAE